jgi:hypothetical protein
MAPKHWALADKRPVEAGIIPTQQFLIQKAQSHCRAGNKKVVFRERHAAIGVRHHSQCESEKQTPPKRGLFGPFLLYQDTCLILCISSSGLAVKLDHDARLVSHNLWQMAGLAVILMTRRDTPR